MAVELRLRVLFPSPNVCLRRRQHRREKRLLVIHRLEQNIKKKKKARKSLAYQMTMPAVPSFGPVQTLLLSFFQANGCIPGRPRDSLGQSESSEAIPFIPEY